MREFREILRLHGARYPLMQPQDYGKLAYQAAFGPRHLVESAQTPLPRLLAEWERVSPTAVPVSPEPIGNGLCRFHLTPTEALPQAASLLSALFFRAAQRCTGREEDFRQRLSALEALPVAGMGDWLNAYEASGFPPVSHSREFRQAYAPHYRVIRADEAGFFPALLALARLAQSGQPAIVAIDGRCGSGKTTLAALIAALLPCNVFHLDDYYLPVEQRQEHWAETPAANMDLARFRREVLLPARRGEQVCSRPYCCRTGRMAEPTDIAPQMLTVVEGSYSHHPLLSDAYDLKLFLTCSTKEQAQRLQAREGAYFEMFRTRWIPLEERYFETLHPARADVLTLDTGDFF